MGWVHSLKLYPDKCPKVQIQILPLILSIIIILILIPIILQIFFLNFIPVSQSACMFVSISVCVFVFDCNEDKVHL